MLPAPAAASDELEAILHLRELVSDGDGNDRALLMDLFMFIPELGETFVFVILSTLELRPFRSFPFLGTGGDLSDLVLGEIGGEVETVAFASRGGGGDFREGFLGGGFRRSGQEFIWLQFC